ncbi:MAG: hypothetical protein JXR77_09675 [Lentisphaeria bacterium]|nr:hypothetical protein [Lentisphaeria bacterium]
MGLDGKSLGCGFALGMVVAVPACTNQGGDAAFRATDGAVGALIRLYGEGALEREP